MAAELITNRTVVQAQETFRVKLRFPQPDQGDLYIATRIRGVLHFYGPDHKFRRLPRPFLANAKLTDDQPLFTLSASNIAPAIYPLYAAVTDPGADIFNRTLWHSGLSQLQFMIKQNKETSWDWDENGWPDDDYNHDGFRDKNCPNCLIQTALLADGYHSIPYPGDLWPSTWAGNNDLYLAFGDATGMANCFPALQQHTPDEFDKSYIEVAPGLYINTDKNNEYCKVFSCDQPLPLCQYTPSGMIRLHGSAPLFESCNTDQQCVISRHIPYGDQKIFKNSDKPSSVIAIDDYLYMALHYPPGEPEKGYIAYSGNNGLDWTARFDSPWGQDSPFKVLMFIQMGQAYALNTDGYLYALGIANEIAKQPRHQAVYLTRIALNAGTSRKPVLNYEHYQYFAGFDKQSQPTWSYHSKDARPLTGLTTLAQGSAIYHPALKRYLFLSGFAGIETVSGNVKMPVGALFEARHPWGPWYRVDDFPGGFIASLLARTSESHVLYFTGSGGGGLTYNLNIGQLQLILNPAANK